MLNAACSDSKVGVPRPGAATHERRDAKHHQALKITILCSCTNLAISHIEVCKQKDKSNCVLLFYSCHVQSCYALLNHRPGTTLVDTLLITHYFILKDKQPAAG